MPLPLQQIGAVDPGRDGPDSTSPVPGLGTGTVAMRRTSGPPGAATSMTRMDAGRAVMAPSPRLPGTGCAAQKGLKSVRVSKASTPSRRFSHATPA